MPFRRQVTLKTLGRIAALAVVPAVALLLITTAIVTFRPGPAAAATTTIDMGGLNYYGGFYWFCDPSHFGNVCTTTIQVGDTVTWQNVSDTTHTTRECDGSCGAVLPPSPLPIWDSGPVPPSGTYSYQFNTPGVFNYQCNIHPTQMRGQIIVQGPTTPTPTATATVQPTPTPTPLPPVGGVSFDAGGGPGSGGASTGMLAGVVAGAAIAFALGGGAWWASRRAGR